MSAESIYKSPAGKSEIMALYDAVLAQEIALLAEAVQSLPLRCREVMTLRLRFGLSQKEIAVKLKISEHTVKNQLAKGMRRSADYLEARGVTFMRRHSDSPEL